jgi:recombination protein RecA
VKIKVVKNKVAPPFTACEVELMFGLGFSKVGEILDLATEAGIVKKMGSWYDLDGTRLGQGRDKAKEFLLQNQSILDGLEKRIKTGEIV